jgi:hypothetical protein
VEIMAQRVLRSKRTTIDPYRRVLRKYMQSALDLEKSDFWVLCIPKCVCLF